MNIQNTTVIKALFFISKPQELLGAIEARKQFNITESTLVYSCKPGIDKKTIEYLIDKSEHWHDIIFVRPKPYYGYFWVSLLNTLKKEHFNYVFTRGFSVAAYIIHNLNYNEHILLDDGNATVIISEEFKTKGNLTQRFSLFKGLNKKGFKYNLISWLYTLFGISVEKEVNTISFFTFYNLPKIKHQTIYNNNMSWLNALKSEGNLKVTNDIIFVVGTDFCGANILTVNDYTDELLKIKNYYQNKKLVYIPHPREKETFLNHLKDQGFGMRLNTYNIELDFLLANEIPTHIAGTVSTALITLKLIYGDATEVEYFVIQDDKLSESNAKKFKNIYNYQKQYLKEVPS